MDFYEALLGKSLSGGGGGGSATLITKNITSNGTYNASSDNADGYSSVSVDVPNTYTQSDEGKVVQSGALVSQTSTSATTNGTIDTTTNNSVVVNVANSYSESDEGKVVDNGALVAQTAYPSTITSNNTYDTTNYNSVTVNVPVPPTPAESKDVNFYDYDGTILYSYTAQEFAQLSELPANPTHTGLTAQGWNWTLSDAKTYVASYGILDIGQNYITDDGDTRIYVSINSFSLNPVLYLGISNDAELEIDWGDNTSKDNVVYSGSPEFTQAHTYQTEGNYVIKIKCISGNYALNRRDVSSNNYGSFFSYSGTNLDTIKTYSSTVKKVELGSGITHLSGSFYNCFNLESITIPISLQRIGFFLNNISTGSTFYYCFSLKAIILNPSVITNSSTGFYYCCSLKAISIPKDVSINGQDAFTFCSSLEKVSVQNSISSQRVFYNCTSLKKISIPDISTITTLALACFSNCTSLKTITIPSTITSINSNCFLSCYSLETITVNKAEGSITGAPWGAPNATVVWTG